LPSHKTGTNYRGESNVERIRAGLGRILTGRLGDTHHNGKGRPSSRWSAFARGRLFTISSALTVLWLVLIYWGERASYSNHIASCDWESWEKWPSDARPHHLVFIADPQLVDPHTYPGRPWPLSSLTVAFTDKYLKRSYKKIQSYLDPETIIFLGDLFDGGREWDTNHGAFKPSEEQWKSYGQKFWLREYDRFGKIFFDHDQLDMGQGMNRGRRIIASLPGNHDLGFAKGVQTSVRRRFQTYFGEADRVDVVGNHTFVSLDTVSLSAMNLPDALEETWKPPMDFLNEVRNLTDRAVEHELVHQGNVGLSRLYPHSVSEPQGRARQAWTNEPERKPQHELPTVLLTHIPFFREPGTPCGPFRERSPPSAPGLLSDEPNALRVAGGYQYQNVLTLDLSHTIAEKIGNVGYIFSGDDHDYCEVVHHHYTSAVGGIREVTVKSMSWAMGVRKPGFLLASLWNPIDEDGQPLRKGDSAREPTLQSHLCLLPDQLGIFIRYAMMLILTLVALMVDAVITTRGKNAETCQEISPTLPIREPKKSQMDHMQSRTRSSSTSTSTHSEGTGMLAPRSQNSRARSVSPAPFGGYALPTINTNVNGPLINQAGYYGKSPTDELPLPWEEKTEFRTKKRPGFVHRVFGCFLNNVSMVALPVLIWYWWLMRTG